MMERQVGQMVRLIDDLLDLNRISQGKIELRKESVPLSKVLENALETSRPMIEQAGHQLTFSVEPESVFIHADVTRLAQVFANILNNAARYTEKGGRICLTATESAGEAVVSVKDNGVGIPAQMLSKVFEIFTQINHSPERSQGGLGIGLSIAKQLVEMHNGTIEARSDGYGAGSEFIVRLPLLRASASESQPPKADEESVAPARRRILVADDNEDSVLSMALMLEITGNEVRTAADGLEAVQAAAAFRPAVILLDIGMPKLDGYEACRRIRQQPWGRDALIVALTGWGQDEDKRLSKEAGFDHHLVKPVDPSVLEKLLDASPKNDA
jgi:CheY-like chemotaxis protein/two-component sensor histidine kinase